jgi:hypothetical protein
MKESSPGGGAERYVRSGSGISTKRLHIRRLVRLPCDSESDRAAPKASTIAEKALTALDADPLAKNENSDPPLREIAETPS